MFMHRTIFALALLFGSPLGIACIQTQNQHQSELLMQWIETNRPNTKSLQNPPSMVLYNTMPRKERVLQCGELCDHDDGKYELNFYFAKINRIALAKNARRDQLVHELVHAYQYAEDPSIDGTDDSLEEEAIQYQQKYLEEKGKGQVVWECAPKDALSAENFADMPF